MAVRFLKGNIFESQAQWLINPVNCKGVMGAGLAKEFKKRFGVNYEAYFNYCKYGNLKPGELYITHSDCGTTIVNFPTKDDWRDASKIEYICDGLDALKFELVTHGVRSVAIPALGCGLGNLDWRAVKHEIQMRLGDLPDGCVVLVYEPM